MIAAAKKILANSLSFKIVFALIALVCVAPIMQCAYWVFDASYLAAFGIGPELYSRPVFSSALTSLWLLTVVVKPGIYAWCFISLLLFLLLIFIASFSGGTPSSRSLESPLVPSGFLKAVDAIDSATWPSVIFLTMGLLCIIMAALAATYLSKSAKEIAGGQIETYIEDGYCIDTFDNENRGCYSVPVEGVSNALIVINDDKKLICLIKELPSVIGATNGEAATKFSLLIKDKVTGEKILRDFINAARPVSTQNSQQK